MADVRIKSLGRPVLYALIALGAYLTYLVLRPFIVALTWAVMFAILFRKMQVVLTPKLGSGRAALVTTAAVGLMIVLPAVGLISTLVREAPHVTDYLQQTSRSTPPQLQRVWDAARARSPVSLPEDPREFMTTAAQRAIKFLAPHAGEFVNDVLAMLGTLGAMLFALFFFLRDGDMLRQQLCDRLPFSEPESERLMSETRDLVIASIGAGLVVAAAQGIIAGVAFWLLGLGAPVFWGVVTGFCSLLPVVGASIVWVPAAIGLLLSGEIGRGIAMALIGLFGISMADNVLRPLLLTGKTSVSGLVIFFGLLGGVGAFGFIGLVIGPIILVITSRLFEILHHPALLDESAQAKDRIVVGRSA
jgi:predicted PurR-regulated permease PerM